MKLCKTIIVTVLLMMSTAVFAKSSVTTDADLLLFNGKIYTVDDTQPWVEAVAVKNGDIVFAGKLTDAKQWIGANTKQQDLHGKMMLPGFIDSHAHPVMGGAYIRSLALDSFASPEHWFQQIKTYAQQNPDEKILFGGLRGSRSNSVWGVLIFLILIIFEQ